MKKVLGYALLVTSFAIPMVSSASEYRFGEQTSVGATETIVGNIYSVGGNVVSAGSVTGDIIVGGGSVLVTGAVGGDILSGGGNVTIISDVIGDVRAGGGTVLVQGKVGGDLIVGGGQVNIGGTGVNGDVVIGGGTIRVDAPITGNVRIGGGNVYLNAPIVGDIIIDADTVTLGKLAVISGDITYKSSKELVREDGAIVNGKVTFEQREQKNVPTFAGLAAIISIGLILKFLALFVCAFVISVVFKRYSKEIVAKATSRPWTLVGKGLVAAIMLPVISVILLLTVLGIPFGILGILGLVSLLVFTWIMTPIVVGSVAYRYIMKKDEVSWKTILLGTFICSVLCVIPFVGHIAQGLLMLLTLGAIVTLKWEVAREWK